MYNTESSLQSTVYSLQSTVYSRHSREQPHWPETNRKPGSVSSGALDCIYSFWYCPHLLLPAGVMDEMELLSILIVNDDQQDATIFGLFIYY